MSRRNPSTGAEAAAAPRAIWLTGLLRWAVTRVPLHLSLIGLMILWSIPTIALLVSSFREPTAIASSGWWNAIREPFDLTVENYQTVLEKQGMARAFVNSIIISVAATILALVL